jgi:hypothetical protein
MKNALKGKMDKATNSVLDTANVDEDHPAASCPSAEELFM